jgi:hypothetical protein
MEGWRQWRLGRETTSDKQKSRRTDLTSTGLLMEGDYTHNRIVGVNGDVSTAIAIRAFSRYEHGLWTPATAFRAIRQG